MCRVVCGEGCEHRIQCNVTENAECERAGGHGKWDGGGARLTPETTAACRDDQAALILETAALILERTHSLALTSHRLACR